MNTTQRKFAVKRIYSIMKNKALDIAKEDEKSKAAYHRAINIKYEEAYAAISSGKAVLKTLTPAELKEIDSKSCRDPLTIDKLFDFSPLITIPGEVPINGTFIYLREPLSSESSSYCAVMPKNQKRLLAVQSYLEATIDTIMIGDSEEALDAIKSLEKKKF